MYIDIYIHKLHAHIHRQKGSCTLPKVSQTCGFCRSSKNHQNTAQHSIPLHNNWWFGTFLFFLYKRDSNPNWLILFRGVEPTNQITTTTTTTPTTLHKLHSSTLQQSKATTTTTTNSNYITPHYANYIPIRSSWHFSHDTTIHYTTLHSATLHSISIY